MGWAAGQGCISAGPAVAVARVARGRPRAEEPLTPAESSRVPDLGQRSLSPRAHPGGRLSGLAPRHREKMRLREVASLTCIPTAGDLGRGTLEPGQSGTQMGEG